MSKEIPLVKVYKETETKAQSQWWLEDGNADGVISSCRAIEQRQAWRTRRNVMHMRMYNNQFLQQFNANIYKMPRVVSTQELRVSLNIIKSCIDTATSKIAKNRPRSLFLTTRGADGQKLRAKKLTQYIDGVFQGENVYSTTQNIFRDAGIFGTGFVKAIADEDAGKVRIERVIPDEVIVDDNEAIYGTPRTLYHRRFMAKELVLSLWGDNDTIKNAIGAANATGHGASPKPDQTPEADMVYVVEAWHLPSTTDGSDGKHVIAINGAELVSESYKKPYFPIVPFYWTRPVVGFYGAGIVEEIAGIQLEVNKLLRDIQRGQHLVCNPQIWLEHNAHVSKPITNEIGVVNRYAGKEPKFYAPSAFAAEVYNHVWNLKRQAFEIVGISELSATLKKPAGLESRAALREFNDIETERFALVGQEWERFHMKISEIIVDMSQDLYEKDKDLSVNVPGRKFIETIHWADVSMEKDKYFMGVFPVSILGNTPSGKLSRAEDLINLGLVDTDEARAMLDFPDLEAVMSLETASRDAISTILDDIVEKEEYRSPEQFMNLDQALKMAQNTYLRGIAEGLDDDKLELLNRFMKQCLVLKQQMSQAAAGAPEEAPAPAPEPAPEAAPPLPNGAGPVIQ